MKHDTKGDEAEVKGGSEIFSKPVEGEDFFSFSMKTNRESLNPLGSSCFDKTIANKCPSPALSTARDSVNPQQQCPNAADSTERASRAARASAGSRSVAAGFKFRCKREVLRVKREICRGNLFHFFRRATGLDITHIPIISCMKYAFQCNIEVAFFSLG